MDDTHLWMKHINGTFMNESPRGRMQSPRKWPVSSQPPRRWGQPSQPSWWNLNPNLQVAKKRQGIGTTHGWIWMTVQSLTLLFFSESISVTVSGSPISAVFHCVEFSIARLDLAPLRFERAISKCKSGWSKAFQKWNQTEQTMHFAKQYLAISGHEKKAGIPVPTKSTAA